LSLAKEAGELASRPTRGGALVGGARRIAAIAIFAVMLLAAFSLWTLIPFGWIWIGSRLSTTQAPSAGPYALVFFGIVVSIIGVVLLLTWLNRLYEHLIGTTEIRVERVRLWKSLSDDRLARRRWTVLEAVILASVVSAMLSMGAWFLFIAGSPLPSQ
jgi:ABC-type multidrug transport system fused ATPase/permease subunit